MTDRPITRLTSDGDRKLRGALERSSKLIQEIPLGSTEYHLAQLRHAYALLKAGHVKDLARFADGLIAPAIRRFEIDALAKEPPHD